MSGSGFYVGSSSNANANADREREHRESVRDRERRERVVQLQQQWLRGPHQDERQVNEVTEGNGNGNGNSNGDGNSNGNGNGDGEGDGNGNGNGNGDGSGNGDGADRADEVNGALSKLTLNASRPLTNLDSFINTVTPVVPARIFVDETSSRNGLPYFSLGDLCGFFMEGSAYGVGVPFLLDGEYPTTQYYHPTLSGMQLYMDSSKADKRPIESSSDVDSSSSANVFQHAWPGTLPFEFMDGGSPFRREPLSEKIAELLYRFPELTNYRSCDLSPASWICIAWYPSYRVGMGPTLKDLQTAFLSIHPLSTQRGSMAKPNMSDSPTVRLPVIGLASYKLEGSLISPITPQECAQEIQLFQAASNWLNHLQFRLRDFTFFEKNRYLWSG